jgi:hypothetical protein
MAQLTIFDKQKHYSKKDFTCSIGKYSMIYITFRNNSWKRFTASEKIAVYVNTAGKLMFADPDTNAGVVLKLKTGTGRQSIVENTRYLQISGRSWPAILKAATDTVGSFDFAEEYPGNGKHAPTVTENAAVSPAEQIKNATDAFIEKWNNVNKKSEGVSTMPTDADFKQLRARFYYDLSIFLEKAKSNEERVQIWKTIAALYGIKPTPGYVEPELSEEDKKWSI